MKINVYIGTAIETMLPEYLLKRTIKGMNEAASIYRCPEISACYPVDFKNIATPFSFNRLAIPFHSEFTECDWAIYLDSDMLVYENLEELVESASKDTFISVVNHRHTDWQSSVAVFNVMKYDPEKYRGKLHQALTSGGKVDKIINEIGVSACLPDTWNCLDYIYQETKLIHFTYMPTQPWVNPNSRYFHYYTCLLLDTIRHSTGEEKVAIKQILLSSIEEGWINHKVLTPDIASELKITSYKSVAVFIPYWAYLRIKGFKGSVIRSIVSVFNKAKKRVHI